MSVQSPIRDNFVLHRTIFTEGKPPVVNTIVSIARSHLQRRPFQSSESMNCITRVAFVSVQYRYQYFFSNSTRLMVNLNPSLDSECFINFPLTFRALLWKSGLQQLFSESDVASRSFSSRESFANHLFASLSEICVAHRTVSFELSFSLFTRRFVLSQWWPSILTAAYILD